MKTTDFAAMAFVFGLALAASAGGVFEKPPRDWVVSGTVRTSDGKTASGLLYTTLGKALKIYDPEKKKFVKFTLNEIKRIDVAIEIEKEEPYWYWKESGSDEKVYTGKTYPWRKYITTVTFSSGKKVGGYLSGLIYLEKDGRKTRYTLHKRQKGKEGQKPKDLLYVTSVTIGSNTAEANRGTNRE